MANYHSPTVIQQSIPLEDMTELERLILVEIFDSAPNGTVLDLFAEDGPSDLIFLNGEDLRAALKDSRVQGSFAQQKLLKDHAKALAENDEIDIDEAGDWWELILKDIVTRSATLDHLTVTIAYTCDKMRDDGFGGMAIMITASKIRGKSTSDILADFYVEAEANREIKSEKPASVPLTSIPAKPAAPTLEETQTIIERYHETGFAIVVFTPDELGEHLPVHKLEDHMISQGWSFIEAHKGTDDD